MPSPSVLVILLAVLATTAGINRRQAQLKILAHKIFTRDFKTAQPLWLALGRPSQETLAKHFSTAITDPGNTALWLRMRDNAEDFFIYVNEKSRRTIQPFSTL
jgi:hypothetical protein